MITVLMTDFPVIFVNKLLDEMGRTDILCVIGVISSGKMNAGVFVGRCFTGTFHLDCTS